MLPPSSGCQHPYQTAILSFPSIMFWNKTFWLGELLLGWSRTEPALGPTALCGCPGPAHLQGPVAGHPVTARALKHSTVSHGAGRNPLKTSAVEAGASDLWPEPLNGRSGLAWHPQEHTGPG